MNPSLSFSEALDLIKSGNWNDLRSEFRKSNLPTIQQSALRKAIDGFTSVEEIARISGEPPKPTGSGGSPPGGGGAGPSAPKPSPNGAGAKPTPQPAKK